MGVEKSSCTVIRLPMKSRGLGMPDDRFFVCEIGADEGRRLLWKDGRPPGAARLS